MHNWLKGLYLILFSLILTGCAEREPGVYVGKDEKIFSELSPSDVLVMVDGKKFTKQDLLDRAEMAAAIRIARIPNVPKRMLRSLKKSIIEGGTEQFVRKTLLCKYAKSKKIKPTKEEREKFISHIKDSFCGDKRTLDQFYSALGGYADLFKKDIEHDLIIEVYKDRFHKDEIAVSEAEIDHVIANIENYNKSATLTNALVYARATNVWNRLKSGESFDQLAKKFSEDPQKQPGGYWGTFTLKELPNDEVLLRAVSEMKEGMFTPPIEADGGLMIVKLMEIGISDEEPEILIMKPPKTYKLAFILFRLPEFYVPAPRDKIRTARQTEKQDAVYSRLLPVMMRDSRVVYPNGKNLFPTPAELKKRQYRQRRVLDKRAVR